jgi:hypothetical protein
MASGMYRGTTILDSVIARLVTPPARPDCTSSVEGTGRPASAGGGTGTVLATFRRTEGHQRNAVCPPARSGATGSATNA